MKIQLRIITSWPEKVPPPQTSPLAAARLAVLDFCQELRDTKTRHFAFRAQIQERLNHDISFHHFCAVEKLCSEDVLCQMHDNNVTRFRNFAEMRRMWGFREKTLLERLFELERTVWRLEIQGLHMTD
ncbi:uncharacterized protein H6S33_007297 [Morchella sextelata]|uniref:uncharacterized protein n=1 Tax=Morchella sextelata TaxID=1174677 RepID=UPI001D044280|nr:uncharacterized protein H6S33_007297 [Morchella sextelata]KAH0603638.1 hypothetical protein H6S33_007297 [Morchella sextelata]